MNEFFSSLLPYAVQASQRTGVDPRIILAQAALESGYGKHAPGNNLFGIKSHGQAGGQSLATTEVVNGRPVRVTDSFRSYASPGESVAGYADFINSNPRYKPLRTAQGLDAQLQALGQSGYATDPNYAQKVGAIAKGIDVAGLPPALPGKVGGDSMVARNFDPQVAAQTNTPGLAPATNPLGGILASNPGIPTEVAQYAASGEQKSPLQNLFAALAQTPNAPAPDGGSFGDARATGGLLLKALNAPKLSDLLYQKRIA